MLTTKWVPGRHSLVIFGTLIMWLIGFWFLKAFFNLFQENSENAKTTKSSLRIVKYDVSWRSSCSKNKRWDEIVHLFSPLFFHCGVCVSEHGDPHETPYFTIRKLLFHFSRFCIFPKKNIEKSAPKSRPRFFLQKSPKSRPRGLVLGPKTVPN